MTERTASDDAVVIERTFDAPIGVVWRMWTDPAHFAEWYGPDGAIVPLVEMDLRVGGRRLVAMDATTPNGPLRLWFTGEFRAIVENALLVYSESMADEHGNVLTASAMGMPEGHPTSTEVRVELESVGDRTRMVMTHLGIPSDSPGAAGWTMAFDKLDIHLRQHTVDPPRTHD